MRTFFALELPPQLAMSIADWRDRQPGGTGRPVPPANFHVTLAFIGQLADDRLERLCHSVDDFLTHDRPAGSELALDHTGYWPRPGIYWLGPSTWPESLTQLATRLRALATAAGARRDRNRFQPHVTLLRSCDTPPAAPTTAPAFQLSYRHFTLFESRQGRHGVSYHSLHYWNLSAPAE